MVSLCRKKPSSIFGQVKAKPLAGNAPSPKTDGHFRRCAAPLLTGSHRASKGKLKLKGKTMTEHKNIAAALAAAQAEMGKALKSSQNPHFKSKYADLASVCDACLPALNANGIAVIQPMTETELGRSVVTKFIHNSGEALECSIPLIVGKNDMQGLGSAITYARRYGLMSLAGIAPEDDDGNAAAKAAPRTISADQFIALRNAAEEAGVPEQKICAAYGAPSLEQFPVDAFDRAMKKLSATIAANAEQNQPSLGDVLAEALGNE